MVHTPHVLLLHSSVSGRLGCFHILAIVNSFCGHGVCISLQDPALQFFSVPRIGSAGSCDSSIFNFLVCASLLKDMTKDRHQQPDGIVA